VPDASIEDRISAQFGGLPQAEVTEEVVEEAVEVSDLVDLEWEGQSFKIPQAIKDAVMRTDDYTRKTTELSEQRKEIETIRDLVRAGQLESVFSESIAPERQKMELIDAYLKQAAQIDLSNSSMEQIFRHKMEIDSVKEQRASLKESIDQKRAAFQDEQKARIKDLRGKSKEIAAKRIGEFGEETEKAMVKWAVSEGFTESEADQVMLHPLSAVTLWKAMQFDKIKAGTTQAAERATKAPPSLKPGAASERMPAKTIANLNLQKALKAAGNDSNAKARAIEGNLMARFGK
jgi:hypothetical protein